MFNYFIYWNWLPDSFTNYWNYVNPEAQALGNESITMAIGSPERNAKLRRFQEIVNGDIGLVPLLRNLTTSSCGNTSRAMFITLTRSPRSPS